MSPRTLAAQSVSSIALLGVAALRVLLLLPALTAAAVLLRRGKVTSTPEASALEPAWAANDRLWETAHSEMDLSVVIPFFNPGDSMRPTVDRLVTALRAEGVGFEIICVSDGSTDGSELTLVGAGDEVRTVINAVNRGKGAALHTGFSHAQGHYIGMVDCDGDIDPLHLVDYLRRAQAHDADVVYADKRLSASTSASSGLRKVVSLGFSTFVGALFALGVQDTQTGCKLFSRNAMQTVLPRLREERFAFDLEFFVAAKAAGLSRLHAAPVHLSERLSGSTVTSKAILRTMSDALTVFGRLHLTPTYNHGTAPVAAHAVPRASVAILPAQRVVIASRDMALAA